MSQQTEQVEVAEVASNSYPVGQEPLGLASASLATLTVVLWGGTAVANKFLLDVLPPIFVGGARFGLAAVFMFFWCLVGGNSIKLSREQWKWPCLVGFFLFAQISLFNLGTHWSSSSHAAVILNTYIFWVLAYEGFVLRRVHLRWWQVLGLILAAGGCLLLFFSTSSNASPQQLDTPSFWGNFILAISGIILATKIMITKAAVRHVEPGPLIFWHDIVGTSLFFVCSYLIGERVESEMTTNAWIALLYGGLLVSGFCFGANAWLLKRHGASQVSVFSFATPICGVVLGVLMRGDHLSVWLVIAGTCVALGIILVNRE